MASDDFIEVSIALSVDDKTRHWLYFRSQPRTDDEKEKSIHKADAGGSGVQLTARVYDGRGNEELSLDDASFELVECSTALSTEDFYKIQAGDDTLQGQYYDEVSSFVKKKLGCDKVICFHSQVRNADKSGNEEGVQGYASGGPHTDSSAVSADELALSMTGGEDETYERYMYLNLWRNISDDPIENDHLAMLDERTAVKPDDYIVKDLFGDGYSVVQYGLNARHACNHKWYYFPRMKKNEAILFKQMDSDWTKPARICFHMSAPDPTAKEGAKKRESIELRMMCLWKKNSGRNTVDSMPSNENINQDKIRDPLAVANELGASSINSASAWDLTWALFGKIPLLGRLLVGNSAGPGATLSTYSGDPNDFLEKFIATVNSFPSWPGFAVKWVKGQMKQEKSVEAGIAAITRELVNDSMGYQGTKYFKTEEKKEIAAFLIGNEKYMETAKKHWGDFVR